MKQQYIINAAREKIDKIANEYIKTAKQPKSNCFDPDEYKKNWKGPTIQKMLGIIDFCEVLVGEDENLYSRFSELAANIRLLNVRPSSLQK